MDMIKEKFYKARPIFELLNRAMNLNNADEYSSVDEVLALY